jgi:ribulose-phosphate 3-epimerase
MIITPAILAKDEKEFRDYLSFAHQLPNGRWHIDILDGSMHDTVCWHDANIVGDIPDLPEIELHLMVLDPFPHILAWHRAVQSLQRVLLDADTFQLAKVIEQVRALRLDISLTLNPHVLPDICIPYISSIDEILIMGVHPGASGKKFLGEEVLARIARTRALFPQIDVAVDGGIQEETAEILAQSGVTRMIASSALWKAASPVDAHQTLQEAAKIVL